MSASLVDRLALVPHGGDSFVSSQPTEGPSVFGGLLVPIKALIVNTLSLTATFGAMVWIFQDGHLSNVLDFTPTGLLDTTTPVLMFCVAFGLSMDYEVFLLSRIKEEHDKTGDNTTAVAAVWLVLVASSPRRCCSSPSCSSASRHRR
jgi:uncharacterized membrane protein YdfJ with MMPL/SSD domain